MPSLAPVAWIVVSSLLFATMSALIKVASADVSLPAIVFFRNLPSAVALYAYARLSGHTVTTPHWRLHGWRSVVGVTGMGMSFYAIAQLPLATASTLEHTAPIFLLLWALLFSRRDVRFGDISAMAIGFLGVGILLKPTLQDGQALPFLAGLVSAVTASVAYRLLSRLGQAGEPGWRIVFFYSWSAAAAGLFIMPLAGPSTYTLRSMAVLLGIGIVGMGAQLAMTRAFRVGSTGPLATLQYSTVVFAAAYGVVLWGEKVSLSATTGLLLIVLSGLMVAWAHSR